MIIALDYDDTYTEDPDLWDEFVNSARASGHEVHLVTMRYESEPVKVACTLDGLHYTGRKAKLPFVTELGLRIDVWIDDRPDFVLYDA